MRDKLRPYQVVLGSQSPRRKYLLQELGIDFEQRVIETDEQYPESLSPREIAPFLAKLKGDAHAGSISANELIITADTIVVLNGTVLQKPIDREDAFGMLRQLSGQQHHVYTGVCITSTEKQSVFGQATDVTFHVLTDEEIYDYIDSCEPFDKAGSYGIQEWMGYAGIKSINGDFFSVMGLPLQLLYKKLNEFID